MKSFKYYPFAFTLFLFLLALLNANAQERLIPLSSNTVIKNYISEHPIASQKKQIVDTLNLPFVDDFSATDVFPDEQKWSDKLVFINNNYAINPISINVATFDGLDANGNAYDQFSPNSQGYADTLTSKPLYLLTKPSSLGGGQYSLADSITMSFYFERKGYGDGTENNDSLVLQYYNPTSSTWIHQWAVDGTITANNDKYFTKVELRLKNAIFLVDGFRFRFINYGGLTGSQDNWNIDYVRFYKAKNLSNVMDTALVDVAFTQPGKSQLINYTSIPWNHFKSLSAVQQQALIKDSLRVDYRVNDIQNEDVGFNNRIYDFAGNYIAGFGAANGNILINRPKNIDQSYTLPVDSIFPINPSLSPDSTSFTIKNYFSNSNSFGGLNTNDTISYTQNFSNFYSYDDGTAEAGYDLYSSPNGKVAMSFDIIKPDTLRAIRIAFVQQLAHVSNKLFTLKVWTSITPEVILYQQPNMKPVYTNSVNGFSTYVLNQILPVSGKIYIGFQQVAVDSGIHLGFDKNTVSNTKMFYNVTGTWISVAAAPGSFMMRPVMGSPNLFVGLNENNNDISRVNIYPNPVANQLKINFSQPEKIKQIEILNVQGQRIYREAYSDVINLENLPEGMYLIKFTSLDETTTTKKFVKRNIE